jgi:hypothetical protein
MRAVIALGLPWGLQAALGAGITKQQRHQIFSYLQQYLLQCGVVALM